MWVSWPACQNVLGSEGISHMSRVISCYHQFNVFDLRAISWCPTSRNPTHPPSIREYVLLMPNYSHKNRVRAYHIPIPGISRLFQTWGNYGMLLYHLSSRFTKPWEPAFQKITLGVTSVFYRLLVVWRRIHVGGGQPTQNNGKWGGSLSRSAYLTNGLNDKFLLE